MHVKLVYLLCWFCMLAFAEKPPASEAGSAIGRRLGKRQNDRSAGHSPAQSPSNPSGRPVAPASPYGPSKNRSAEERQSDQETLIEILKKHPELGETEHSTFDRFKHCDHVEYSLSLDGPHGAPYLRKEYKNPQVAAVERILNHAREFIEKGDLKKAEEKILELQNICESEEFKLERTRTRFLYELEAALKKHIVESRHDLMGYLRGEESGKILLHRYRDCDEADYQINFITGEVLLVDDGKQKNSARVSKTTSILKDLIKKYKEGDATIFDSTMEQLRIACTVDENGKKLPRFILSDVLDQASLEARASAKFGYPYYAGDGKFIFDCSNSEDKVKYKINVALGTVEVEGRLRAKDPKLEPTLAALREAVTQAKDGNEAGVLQALRKISKFTPASSKAK